MASNHNHQAGEHHVIPMKVYMAVAAALFVLTFLTVGAHNAFHAGFLKTFIAFAIATVKAFLVVAYFMHLKYDNMINRVIFGSAFFFLFLLIIFCVLDIFWRIPVTSPL